MIIISVPYYYLFTQYDKTVCIVLCHCCPETCGVCDHLVTDAAQDLIRQCLSIDPSKRPSNFDELLQHPWLNHPAEIVRTLFE